MKILTALLLCLFIAACNDGSGYSDSQIADLEKSYGIERTGDEYTDLPSLPKPPEPEKFKGFSATLKKGCVNYFYECNRCSNNFCTKMGCMNWPKDKKYKCLD